MSGVWVLQRGNSGDGCDLASTLCKYDWRKVLLLLPFSPCSFQSGSLTSR